MADLSDVSEPVRGDAYRVYRFPEPARRAITARPTGETIRAFVERTVDERLPDLLASLMRLGLQDPGPTRPLRLPVGRALLDRLSEAGRAAGLPASRLLLMVLTADPPRRDRRTERESGLSKRGGQAARSKSAAKRAPTGRRNARKSEATLAHSETSLPQQPSA